MTQFHNLRNSCAANKAGRQGRLKRGGRQEGICRSTEAGNQIDSRTGKTAAEARPYEYIGIRIEKIPN